MDWKHYDIEPRKLPRQMAISALVCSVLVVVTVGVGVAYNFFQSGSLSGALTALGASSTSELVADAVPVILSIGLFGATLPIWFAGAQILAVGTGDGIQWLGNALIDWLRRR